MKALMSAYDKTGIVELATELRKLGFDIIASGGTAKVLLEVGLEVQDVAEIVGGGPILGHRVVTLSREIHAGLLAREEDRDELEKLGIPWIDLVYVNLYPLHEAIDAPDRTIEKVTEMTDIGGPTLLRSAAKGRRLVMCDRSTAERVVKDLKAGRIDENYRLKLAAMAEHEVAKYAGLSAGAISGDYFLNISVWEHAECRYGENPQIETAFLYTSGVPDPLALDKFKLVAGAPPSFVNWTDLDRLLQTSTHIAAGYELNFGGVPFIAIAVKHGNPCGAAVGNDAASVLQDMISGDTRAIFGGVVMTNFPIDEVAAETLLTYQVGDAKRRLLDAIIAPAFDQSAIDMLSRKGDKCRFIVNPALANLSQDSLDQRPRFRFVRGGFLVQDNYNHVLDLDDVTEKVGQATPEQEKDMVLAWAIGSTSNSNTITLVRNQKLVGNGVGQQDRVGAAELAIKRALDSGNRPMGAVAYSDSFFPFPDGVKVLAEGGIKAILATSGSQQDKAVANTVQLRRVVLYRLPDTAARGFFGH